jgi:WD40 repeat protein
MWMSSGLKLATIAYFVCSIAAAASYGDDRTSTSASDGFGQTLVFYGDEVAPPRLGQPKRSVLYAFDPVRDKAPRAVLTTAKELPEPVAIVGRDVLVLHDGLLDARSGKRTPFLETGNDTKVLAVKDGKVHFSEELAFETAIVIDSSHDDRATIKSYRPAHCRLYVVDTLRGRKTVRLTDLEIEEVVGRDDDCYWVVSYDKPRHLYRVPLDPGSEPERIMSIADDWVGFTTACVASPNGRYLAVASMDGKCDLEERLICVFDRAQKKPIFRRNDVPHRQIGGNISPIYILDWLDDNLLHYGFFDVPVFNISTGEHLLPDEGDALIRKKVTLENERRHDRNRPLESTRDGRLFFHGEFEPIAVSPDQSPHVWRFADYAISADGAWAVVDVPGDDRVYLIDGKARTRTVLQEGRGRNFTWLTPGVVGNVHVDYCSDSR